MGRLSNSYVQPYSCYELGCVLLNTPEASFFFAVYMMFEKETPLSPMFEMVKKSHNLNILFCVFSVCGEGQNANASGQGIVGLHDFFCVKILSKVS